MSSAKASLWAAASTLVKISAGLLVSKLLAVLFGPTGLGLAVNSRQLITVLDVFAGVGISNGATRYAAQCHDNLQQLRRVVGTSSTMVPDLFMLMALVFVLIAAPVNQGLPGSTNYQGPVHLVVLVQMGIIWDNLLLAPMKGFRDVTGNVLPLIVSSLIGVLAYYISYRLDGHEGASLGLVLIPASVVIPAVTMLIGHGIISLSYPRPSWDNGLIGQLSKLTFVALTTSATLPVAYITMCKLPTAQYSWDEVGIWQGVNSASGAYPQFVTISFSIYLLPTLSRLTEERDITREVVKSLKFVLPAVAAASSTVWPLRDFAIWLLLSNKSTTMRGLFAWQLVGDVLKAGAYVLGYPVIAKMSLRFYILAEISQLALLVVFTHQLIPTHGTLGTAQAHIATYIVYFSPYCGVFLLRHKQT